LLIVFLQNGVVDISAAPFLFRDKIIHLNETKGFKEVDL
jgi:hypothetical protein